MGYRGNIIPVPFGSLGLESDVSQVIEPPFALLRATNVQCRYGFVEKAPGSRRWNQSPLGAGIADFIDWWPDDINQRMIVCCKDGKVYRYTDPYTVSEVTSQGSTLLKLNFSSQTFMLTGGSENAGSSRKLFVFSGNDPVQVIAGDGTTRYSMTKPALDWGTQNWPTAGLVFGGSLWAFGNKNNPHAIYRSNINDHEDFQTGGGVTEVLNVFPGEAERIVCAFAYKTRIFIVKYPFSLYYIDTTTSPKGVFKIGDSFGAASSHAAIQVLDDMMIANSSGSITSLSAVFALGNVEQGDVLKTLKNLKYMQENTSAGGISDRHSVYYEDKKQAMFAYRSPSGFKNDRILVIDFHADQPKVSWFDKDQPNCLSLVKDFKKIGRPFYGADDGYIYQMDHPMRNVGGSAYSAAWETPHLDFSFVDKKLEEIDKQFDFIGLAFQPSGNWNLQCDVFIDGLYSETVQFNMSNGVHMDGKLTLDKSRLQGPSPFSRVMPIHGMGKRISLRFTQSGLNQSFQISAIQFYFRTGGQNNKG